MDKALMFSKSQTTLLLKKQKIIQNIKRISSLELIRFIVNVKRKKGLDYRVFEDSFSTVSYQVNKHPEFFENIFSLLIYFSFTNKYISQKLNIKKRKEIFTHLLRYAFDYISHQPLNECLPEKPIILSKEQLKNINFLESFERKKNLQLIHQKKGNLNDLRGAFYLFLKISDKLDECIRESLGFNIFACFIVAHILVADFNNVYCFDENDILNKKESYNETITNKELINALRFLSGGPEEYKKYIGKTGIKADPEYENFSLNPIVRYPLIKINNEYYFIFRNLIFNLQNILIHHLKSTLRNDFSQSFGKEYFQPYCEKILDDVINNNSLTDNSSLFEMHKIKENVDKNPDVIIIQGDVAIILEFKSGLRMRREFVNSNNPDRSDVMLMELEKGLMQLNKLKENIIKEECMYTKHKNIGQILGFIVVVDEDFSSLNQEFLSQKMKEKNFDLDWIQVISIKFLQDVQWYLKKFITFSELFDYLEEGEGKALEKLEEKFSITKEEEHFLWEPYNEIFK